MTRRLLTLVATLLLTGCAVDVATVPAGTGLLVPAKVNVRETAGLPVEVAAHTEIEALAPSAFALMPDAVPFVQALSRSVEPLRLQLAQSLASDPTIRQGLTTWDRLDNNGRLAVLQRASQFEAQVMNFATPPIVMSPVPADSPKLMAIFDPSEGTLGQVTIYPAAVARGAGYLALSTVVHEMRHAAQYQMIKGDLTVQAADSADVEALAAGYAAAWQAMDKLGGQSRLSYGDYAHLNVEFDAFQTGNEVAAIVSQGQFDQTGFGFVDSQYQANATPLFNLLTATVKMAGSELVASVNAAQAQAERGRTVTRQRNAVTVAPSRIVFRPGRRLR